MAISHWPNIYQLMKKADILIFIILKKKSPSDLHKEKKYVNNIFFSLGFSQEETKF